MDAQEAKRLVKERHPEARYTDSGIGTGVIQANDGVLGDSMMSPEHEGAEDAAWIAAEIASRLSPQPETAQGENLCYCSPSGPCIYCYMSEPSQPENAPQPETAQVNVCPTCCGDGKSHEDADSNHRIGVCVGCRGKGMLSEPAQQPETAQGEKCWMVELDGLTFRFTKGGTEVITCTFTDPLAIRNKTRAAAQEWADTLERRSPWMKGRLQIAEHIFMQPSQQEPASQPQPAESDGFEEWWKEKFDDRTLGWTKQGIARAAWQASRQSLPCFEEYLSMKVRAEAAEAKLASLLAQKPEATVSFDRLAEVYNDSPLDGSVSHLCIEVMKYRQLLKDAEKGQGK